MTRMADLVTAVAIVIGSALAGLLVAWVTHAQGAADKSQWVTTALVGITCTAVVYGTLRWRRRA